MNQDETPHKRRPTGRAGHSVVVMARDALICVASFIFSLLLRFEFEAFLPRASVRFAMVALPLLAATLLLIGFSRGLYAGIAQYTGLRDLSRLAGVVGITFVLLLIGTESYFIKTGVRPMPRSVTFTGMLLTFLGMGGVRIAGRLRASLRSGKAGSSVERVLIVGAGDAGEHVARDMLRTGSRFVPVGFLDDDKTKIGRRIHGLQVLGATDKVADAVALTRADHVLVAIPSAPSRVIQDVLKRVSLPGLGVKVLPSLGELMGSQVTSADIRDVDISDLIARSQVTVDAAQIGLMLNGKTVLITGAAGSIGSQLARQALNFTPERLALLDNDENDLYEVVKSLSARAASRGVALEMVVADIRDALRIDQVLATHRPDLVLHAAAYKHVPVMESHPDEAVITNVTGTRNLVDAAGRSGCERFVLVSSDKAVNPSSVMGATKRLAEMVMAQAHQGPMICTSVRFGNVLASRGSVVPIFQRQIREGGPITVTHEDATRYFMTIEEAVSLIWQAAALASGGEIFLLEMGEPVKIMDLAKRMRSLLANGQADRVDIVVTGLRPGERLHENLWMEDESSSRVRPGILKSNRQGDLATAVSEAAIKELEGLARQHPVPGVMSKALFAILGDSKERQTP